MPPLSRNPMAHLIAQRRPRRASCMPKAETLSTATWRRLSAEHKIKVVREELRDEDNIAELSRKEGIAQSLTPPDRRS